MHRISFNATQILSKLTGVAIEKPPNIRYTSPERYAMIYCWSDTWQMCYLLDSISQEAADLANLSKTM